MKTFVTLLVFLVTVVYSYRTCKEDPACADPGKHAPLMNKVMPLKIAEWEKCAAEGKCPDVSAKSVAGARCVGNKADVYPCKNVDLLSFLSLGALTAKGDGNDIWGWVDSKGREIAIMGTYERTAFVDVTDAENPSVLGYLLTHTSGASWRDIKVFKDHAFIVSEAPNHGMQVFDLTQLENIPRNPVFESNYTIDAPIQFEETAFYGQFGNCHNIAINEATGYAYAVGTRTCGGGGLHIVDIRDPKKPVYAGCFGADGYVHDTQCVIYDGPDTEHTGKEICFCYNEEHLTIVDVTTKTAPTMISTIDYNGVQYTHQGWLLPGSKYLLLDDELDELYNSAQQRKTRTMVWDVSNLEEPELYSTYLSSETVIDHNLYTLKDRAYLSNYCGGLRIYDTTAPSKLEEVAYFDVAPDCSTTSFLGTWSNYPYFPSGNIVVSSIERGLFVLKYNRE